jgi:hypothetical protein
VLHAVQAAIKHVSKAKLLGAGWVKKNDFTERTSYHIPFNV